jgi:aminoglycoside phosphotransferase (APT) family kinase protein
MPTAQPNPKFEIDPDAPFLFPDAITLSTGLTTLLSQNKAWISPLTIVDRDPNEMVSTFASEIVTCRFGDGQEERFFCKYTAGRSHHPPDARQGLAYEAEVYQHVLSGLSLPVPGYFGSYRDPATGDCWLVLEWLDKSLEISFTTDVLPQAATWVGQFHAITEEKLRQHLYPFLRIYSADYYRAWAHRLMRLAEPLPAQHGWVRTLCRRYEERIPLLLAAPATIIHGEFTPENVLLQQGRVVPIDWESAAVAPGEIDLAVIAWEWDDETVQACEANYQKARWPEGTPTCFAETLKAAQLYAVFHWLTGSTEWQAPQEARVQLRELREVAERLEIL